MSYSRPRAAMTLTREEKDKLISNYFQEYRKMAAVDQEAIGLNVKISRKAFAELIDGIGALLIEHSRKLASEAGPVREFLNEHMPPGDLGRLLPDDYRVFCLALNALKQWVSAEQAATDRYLLGGTAREALRNAANACTVTGNPLDRVDLELHHPMRDGRPPIPVSKSTHALLEKQTTSDAKPHDLASATAPADTAETALVTLKRSGSWSWVMLRRGCLDLLGRPANHTTAAVGASSRSFARNAMATTGRDCTWLLSFLDERRLGLLEAD